MKEFKQTTLVSDEEEQPPAWSEPSQQSVLLFLRSVFKSRPPTILFDYPIQCQKESRLNPRCFKGSGQVSYKLCKQGNTYNCVVNSLKHAGLVPTRSRHFNVFYGGLPKHQRVAQLQPGQKYNHFPGSWHLGRKDLLYRNIARMKRHHPTAYEICPVTYILPDDLHRFSLDQASSPYWIFKPAASSCGKGIKLVHKSIPKKAGVISKYIASPHTLQGRKYDLRLYVLVTSYDPLKIYLYEEGLVRLATEPYRTDKHSLANMCVHLTNYSINKKSANYVKNQCENEENSCKWSLATLRRVYAELGIDYSKVFKRIQDLIIKTCISVEGVISNNMTQLCQDKSGCFELYGFDILLDSKLKPWLLEVNVSPSLSSGSKFDRRVKTTLMCDIFTLIGIVPPYSDTRTPESAKRTYRNAATVTNKKSLFNIQLSADDLNIILTAYEEESRKGGFQAIFPFNANVTRYRRYFESEKYANALLWKAIEEPDFLNQFYDPGLYGLPV